MCETLINGEAKLSSSDISCDETKSTWRRKITYIHGSVRYMQFFASEPAVWPSVTTRPCCGIYTELRVVADGHFFFFSRCTLEKERKSKKGKQKKNLSTGTLKRFHNFSSVVLSAWFYLQVSRNRKWVPSYLLQELQEIFPVTFFQRFAVAKAPTLFILWETIIIYVLDSCDWIIDINVPHSWLFRCQ